MRILRFGLLLGAPLLVAAMDGNEIVRPMEGTLEIHTAELQFGPEEGRRTVHYQLEIDTRGRPKSCRVTRPSGDKAFDKSVCAELRKKARFNGVQGQLFQSQSRYFNGYFYSEPRQ
jgi:TonB family protein